MAELSEYQINAIVTVIKNHNPDGEDMQMIIERTGMAEQMLRQLVMSYPLPNMLELMDEKIELDQGGWVTSGSNVDWANACGSI